MIENDSPPWGRPGGGAPNKNIRMTNIIVEGLHPEPQLEQRLRAMPRLAPFKTHPTQPIRMLSKSVGIGDNATHIQSTADRHGFVDVERRNPILPGQRRGKGHRNKSVTEYPSGRTGPSGLPWRHPAALGNNFMYSVGWTNKQLLHSFDPEVPKNAVHNLKSTTDGEQINRNNRNIKLPAIQAPYHTEMDKQSSQGREHDKACNDSGIELVPLFARHRYRTDTGPKRLTSTDVTNPKIDCPNRNINYLNDLCRQVKRREYESEKNKANELELSQKHFETWGGMWGRPGAGAPKPQHNSRLNLYDLLYKCY